MTEKPFVLPIQTPLGNYIYDANCNNILKVGNELFRYVTSILSDDEVPEENSTAKRQYAELQECGYLLPSIVEEIKHPVTDQTEILLDRRMDKLTLQVTQQCNLRCKYCIYSENVNPN